MDRAAPPPSGPASGGSWTAGRRASSARTPYPPEGPGPARDGALRGADDEPRTDEGRETSGLRTRERRTEPPRPRFHPQSEDACRTSPRAPGVGVHVRVTGKEAPPEGVIVLSGQAATAGSNPLDPARRNGSLSITSAITAQKIPDWPETALTGTSEPGRRAYVVGLPEECSATLVHRSDDQSERTAVPADSWPARITELGVTEVCIDDHGMFRAEPGLASDIENLVRHGMQVVVAVADVMDGFDLVTRLSHLGPKLLTRRGTPPDSPWRILQEQAGHALDAHRTVIETVCGCHPALAQLFLTALRRTGEDDPFPESAIIEALAEAVAYVVRTQFARPRDQAVFLLCRALRADPATTPKGCQYLGAAGSRSIRSMAQVLSSEPVPAEVTVALWQQLRVHLDASTFAVAQRALLALLSNSPPGDADHLGPLELLASGGSPRVTHEVAELVRRAADAAGTEGRRCIVQALPELAGDSSAGEAAARLAVVCADTDLGALGAALRELDASGAAPDAACTALSPPVALEHPVLVARLAERVLDRLGRDDPRAVTAALSWIMTSPTTTCTEPMQRLRVLRRIVAMSHDDGPTAPVIRAGVASLRAFARRSTSRYLRGLVARQGLSSGGLPLIACCPAGPTTCLSDRADDAAVWCWRARALVSPHGADYAWTLIVHSLIAFHRQDTAPAGELLSRAAEATAALHASAVTQFCGLAIQYLEKDSAGADRHPAPDDGIHVILHVFATHCAANLDQWGSSVQSAIDKYFAVGRALASAELTNPLLLNWRQRLRVIFVACHEDAMAECLQNDIHAALESWRTVNSSSDAIIPHEDDGTGTDDGDGSLALSTSEWRVVERVIAGCTNAQAAEALYLSKRTVDTHLRNIHRRLGIPSRTELIKIVGASRQEPAPARRPDQADSGSEEERSRRR